MNIGFIGLGVMGAPMAKHLVETGHNVITSLNRSTLPPDLTNAGVRVENTPAEVARLSELIITMLPNTPDVDHVLFGENGVAEGLSAGKIVVDMSSISPTATESFAARVEALGCGYLDAPVSGGEVGAKAASLTIMIGGKESVFEKVKPIFELMGKNITLVGEKSGSGQICKIANQMIVAMNIEAVAEALVFASKAGCDPSKIRSALLGGFASSRILEVHGERMINRTFNPGFRIRLHQKDLALALEAAQAIGVAMPNTATCQQLFNSVAAQGKQDEDHSGLVQALEALASHPVA
ncbi:2-hydroxy-3-oxopropionate reductase [Falsochrobactrum sp. TDYN1]|uniref:2-hydroxy-3-oxopropionate reductase n=1 Tax=Falsochrobactrum tianjinense TaxID=2706015 RepID=A0A949PLD9_9HYPH|nr:2-hydroxy-3-oxopropionate reductase [Falsochrobactrum sp. TDYN1]MBV2143406.1 2-hydroxy-3-oxopropionate reductase [Falsochrobactrum sp. TDYN1]